ncbi:hypothetical protein IFM89_031691 [Coptis chinensis]|uniref:Uncharacterized protein n=1 Tax=Coptis chinensis TaxID=261450 RepID=A0A835LX95_9MAGN|nr:hypothetical protein IFM89_031691 [Coptis chinensis]
MCWRIWNLARTKKQIEGEEAQRQAKHRVERERGRREATTDMSEDLSEGEKGDVVGDISAHGDSNRGKMPRINSTDVMDSILHGLICGENMELGRDSDTGGQIKYVVELARALGMMTVDEAMDLVSHKTLCDWNGLKAHVHFPRLESACYICLRFSVPTESQGGNCMIFLILAHEVLHLSCPCLNISS